MSWCSEAGLRAASPLDVRYYRSTRADLSTHASRFHWVRLVTLTLRLRMKRWHGRIWMPPTGAENRGTIQFRHSRGNGQSGGLFQVPGCAPAAPRPAARVVRADGGYVLRAPLFAPRRAVHDPWRRVSADRIGQHTTPPDNSPPKANMLRAFPTVY